MSRIKYSEPSRLLTLNVAGGQASVKYLAANGKG